jgi:hypothetical protein
MAALILPVGSALFVKDATGTFQKLTEHNRSPIQIDIDRIDQSVRMSNGTLRKLFIADKKSLSVSWSMVPSYSTMTVDGGWGAEDIKSFYASTLGQTTFTAKIAYNLSRTEEFFASFESCSFSLIKRNVKEKTSDAAQAFWDVSISLVEV